MVVTPGLRTGEDPVETKVPPQLPEYQLHKAFVPRLPPVRLKVVELPLQIGVVPVTEEARVDNVLTITVVLTQIVELQVPLAKT